MLLQQDRAAILFQHLQIRTDADQAPRTSLLCGKNREIHNECNFLRMIHMGRLCAQSFVRALEDFCSAIQILTVAVLW